MVPATWNLVDQLAIIAAKLDTILASLRDDVEEIKAQVIKDGCNSEESDGDLKNTVEEEPQVFEHAPFQQLRSDIGGGTIDRNNETADGIEVADEMDDGMHVTKLTKLMALELKLGGWRRIERQMAAMIGRGEERLVLSLRGWCWSIDNQLQFALLPQ